MDAPKLDDALLPVFSLLFMSIYVLGYFVIFKNWDKKYRFGASSCLMSLTHGTPAFILSIYSILQSQNSIFQLDFTSPNTSFQNSVLEYSIAYFLMDLLHYMFLVPSDVVFITHHFAALYVLSTCRYLFGHGSVAILGVLFLAEVTSPCQNAWTLARYQKLDSAKAAGLLEFLSPIFYGYYTLVRGILGPLFVNYLFTSDVANGLIPKWAWISWTVVMAAGIVLSILWILHQWINLFKERSKNTLEKQN